MGYTDVFGGELLFPSQLSYLAITTSVDVTLQWPREQQIEGQNVVADFLDISTTAPGLNIDMPDARNTSQGNKTTVNNVGGNDFTLRDATGGTIQFIGTGEQWVIVLTDNSTEAGTWSAFQLGAATTLASASALAGAGLQADGFGLLEQIIDSDVEAATPVTVVDGDRAKCLIYTAGAGTCNLPSPGTVGNNWFFMLRNSGSGTLNIVPGAGTIDGSANINLDPNGSTFIFTDGSDYYTIGLTVASTIAFDFVSIAVPGSGDFTLTGANLDRISYRFTGALTGNRRIIVPNTTQQYWVDNQTSGAFTLEVTTAAGSGQTIPQGQSAITYCDATDVINAVSSTSVSFPITIGQGGTSATTASGARTNLNAAFDGIVIGTAANSGLSGGGDLTGNRDLVLDIDNLDDTPTIAIADFIAFEDTDDGMTYKAPITDLDTLLQPESLFDSGGNVAVNAAGSSVVQLRSVGNGDALIRRLNFTHQDGTLALTVGQTSFSEEFIIQNNINHPDGDILISTTGTGTYVQMNGLVRIDSSSMAQRGSLNNNAVFRLTDTSFTTRASIGYNSSDQLRITNLPQQDIYFEGENSITAVVDMLRMNPNRGVELFFNNDGQVANTLAAASGGFEVNNTLTGGGFERVLTTSDIDVTITTGTYNGVLTGVVGVVNATIDYTIVQNAAGDGIVYLYDQAGSLGTSNATSFTITGAPAAIRPTNTVSGFSNCLDNSANSLNSLTRMDSAGTLTFLYPTAANNYSNTGWTAANLKGLLSGWCFSYRLN